MSVLVLRPAIACRGAILEVMMSVGTMRWLAVLSLLVAMGCSKKDDPLAKEGEACTVDADCEDGLACRDQACVVRAGGDMGNNETDGGDENNTSNNVTVNDEDYYVSYTLRDIDRTDTLWIFDTETGDHTQITPEGESCPLGCWVSGDLDFYLVARANGANFDVLAAPLNGFEVQGQPMPIAEDVRRIEVLGNAITYVREEEGENRAYYLPLDGSMEILLGTIGGVMATEGDWHLDTESGLGVVFNATLQTMDVKVGSLGSEVSELTYTIDSSNYQETSGSYFGGSIPTAFSADGSVMAVVTTAPNDYNLCENESECTGVGQRCGRFGRCSAIEVTVHFFDLSKIDGSDGHLGQPCSADDTCGPIHTCDIPAEDAVDQAVCIPRRVVLGLPGQQMQNGQTGCALTSGNDDLFYTEIRPPISFGADGALYVAAARACDEANIEHTAILRLQPDSYDYAPITSNEMSDFSADDCYDPVEERIDTTNCTIWIQRALVSPGGNSIAFVGTNPNVLDSALAESNVDLWTIKRNGDDREWVGGHAELDVVRNFAVHEK